MATIKTSNRTVTVLIPSGSSVSDAVDIISLWGDGRFYASAIELPSSWTTANLTVQYGDSYLSLHDENSEIILSAAASTVINLSTSTYYGIKKFKLVSGTSGTPVNQGGDRTIKIYIGMA
jgi:hypothetical protein